MTGVSLGEGAYTAALTGGGQVFTSLGATVGDANYVKMLLLSFAIGLVVSVVMYVIHRIAHPRR